MTSQQRWQRVKELFAEALEREPAARSEFLNAACAGDPALLHEVESLLAEHQAETGFMEHPAVEAVAEQLVNDGADLAIGEQLGHFQIVALLGRGGMGEVYLAEDSRLNRRVALKLLPASFTGDANRLRRFEQEARSASALNHPNILTIHEIGTQNGAHYIATEYVEGETLREHISLSSLTLSESLDIATQIAAALSAAHEAGIVHRDIKPENIMVRRDGIVKVLDFGLAKLTEQSNKPSDGEAQARPLVRTLPGVVMGTVHYMSPEQARAKDVDARTDIWSLGVVLYEMVAGRVPFEGATMGDVIGLILHKEPLPLVRFAPDVPAELERIVTKTLRKDKEERYQGVKEVGLDLKSLKRRLEFEAELERTTSPEQPGSESRRAATGDAASTTGTKLIAAMPTGLETGGASDAIHTTLSAGYVLDEIKRHKRGALIILATLVVAAATFGYFSYARYFAGGGKAGIASIAVLPFTNMTNDPNTEYLSDGISEGLINSLSQLSQLKVIARSSTFKYKGKEIDPEEVANALGVQAIVTGRIAQRGDNLQISVEMVDARDKTQIWGEQYNRKASDLLAVQEEMARTISAKLRLKLTGTQEQQLAKRATQNPEAYQLFLNGEFYTRKTGKENNRKALDYYNQAIALDPNFAEAYVGVAEVYNIFAGFSMLDPKEANAKAKAAVEKALALDETLAKAHAWLGTIKVDEWDWPGAEREFKRALELNPNLSQAHTFYTFYLTPMGRHTEALAEIKRAEELDPLHIRPRQREGVILYNARRYDEAIKQLQYILELQSGFSFAHSSLGASYAMKGMYAEAINEYQKENSNEGEMTSVQTYLGYAYAMSGKRDEALAILDKLKTTKEYVSPAELAILYAGLGDKEGAFTAFEQAYAAHDLQLQYLKVEPHYDSLRSDPRFADLMRRVGLTL